MQKLVDYFVVVGYEQSETSVIPGDVALLDESDYYYNGGYRGSVAAKQMFMQGLYSNRIRFKFDSNMILL